MSPQAWQQASLLALGVLVLAALASDIRQRRIPNRLVGWTLLAGLLTHAMGPQSGAAENAGLFASFPGALGIQGAVLGALTGLAVFLPFYFLRAMGAGDVKLMAGIGSFAGAATTLNLALVILLVGGIQAVAYLFLSGNPRQVLFNLSMALSHGIHETGQNSDSHRSPVRMPYTIAMAGGMLAYGFWIYAGGKPVIRF